MTDKKKASNAIRSKTNADSHAELISRQNKDHAGKYKAILSYVI